MAGLLEELVYLMNEQAEHYENLLALSIEKKDVIINNQVEALQKITVLENRIAAECGRLEKKRLTLAKDIATVLGKDEDELTLSALISMVDKQPECPSLIAVGERIRAAIEALSQINELNRTLINNSLDYIEFQLNLLRSSVSDETHYASHGKNLGGNVFFDAKQ